MKKMNIYFAALITLLLTLNGCKEMKKEPSFTGEKGEVKLLIINPGHFHAHLVLKSMYHQVPS